MYELQHLAESIGHTLLRLLPAVEGLCGKHESHTRVSNSVSCSHGRPMFTRLIILRSSSMHEITLATLFPFVTLLWYYNISSFLFYPHHWGQRPSTASNNLRRLWPMDSARLCTDCCVCSTQAPVFYVDCLLITCYVILPCHSD